MKILFVLPYTYWGGGLQMNRLTLLPELAKFEGVEVAICVLELSGKTSTKLRELGIMEFFLNSKAKFIHLNTTLGLRRVILEWKPDIVHTANTDGDIHGFLATRFTGTKLVLEEVGSPHTRSWAVKQVCRWIYNRADRVLCVSSDILADMRKYQGFTRQDVFVTYNPVNPRHLEVSPDFDPQALRASYSISRSDFVFGIIARIDPFKAHRLIIQALRGVVEKFPNCKFVICGGGTAHPKNFQEIQQEVRKLGLEGAVVFAGIVQNVGEHLEMFDAFVHPSLKEPFGISIIEAMYKRLPVISTNVGGPGEYIVHGESGILIQPGDVDALRVAMLEVLNMRDEERKELGERARQAVVRRFLPEAYADKMLRIYRDMV